MQFERFIYAIERLNAYAGRLIEIQDKSQTHRDCAGGIARGKTLGRFMNEEGISPDEVMVFGDGENGVAAALKKYGVF